MGITEIMSKGEFLFYSYLEVFVLAIPFSYFFIRQIGLKNILGRISFYLGNAFILAIFKALIFMTWAIPDINKYGYDKYLYPGEAIFFIHYANLIYPVSNFYLKNLVEKRRGTGFQEKVREAEDEAAFQKNLDECDSGIDFEKCGYVGSRLYGKGKKEEALEYYMKSCLAPEHEMIGLNCKTVADIFYEQGKKDKAKQFYQRACLELENKNSCSRAYYLVEFNEEKLKYSNKACELGNCSRCSNSAEIYEIEKKYLKAVTYAEKSCLGECKMSCKIYSRYYVIKESADKDKHLLEESN